MDFIPYEVFKDLMLDLVGKYSGPPIAPADTQNTALPHPGRPGLSEPHPQSCKTGVPDNKQACETFSALKGSGFKEGDSTLVGRTERCEEASNVKAAPPPLHSSKGAISPEQPTSKSCPVLSRFHFKKDTSSSRNADQGQSVGPIKSKGYGSDTHSLIKDGDYKKDIPSPMVPDRRQVVSPANHKNEATSSRLEYRDNRASRIEERSRFSEKKRGSADILKAEDTPSTQLAAIPHSVHDKVRLSKEASPPQTTRAKKWDVQYATDKVDAKTRVSIEKLARFLVELGLGMDTFNAEKLSNNPNFAFLKEGRTAAYELLKTKLFEFRRSLGSPEQMRQKEPIQEATKPLQKSLGSAATPKSDCFTAPMLPPLRKRKAEPEAPAAPTKKIPLEDRIDAKTKDAAVTLARFIVRMGPEKERFTKAEAANPKFWFLNQKHHPAYEFYQMKLEEFTKAKEASEHSSVKTPVSSKSSILQTTKSEPESPTSEGAESPSSLLLFSEHYDSNEEDLRSRACGLQGGRPKDQTSRPQKSSSNTKQMSTEQNPNADIRSKRSELRKYLKSGHDLSNESVRAMILARKIAAVKKQLVRDIAVSKKKQIQRSTIGTQTEPKGLLAQELLSSIKRSTQRQRPPAKGKKLKTVKRKPPLKSKSSLQPQFPDVDARTKETAENLARFLVEDGNDGDGGFDLNLISKSPEFWFLNDKHSSAYKFYQMKRTEFRQARSLDTVNANNLDKATPQDSPSHTSKPQDTKPPGFKPLVFLNIDLDCYIVEPQHSKPIELDAPEFESTKPALQPSKPTAPTSQHSKPVLQSSKLIEPAPKQSKPTEPAPQLSKSKDPVSKSSEPQKPKLDNSELLVTGVSEDKDTQPPSPKKKSGFQPAIEQKAATEPFQPESGKQTPPANYQLISDQDSGSGQGKPRWNPNQASDFGSSPKADAVSLPTSTRIQGRHPSASSTQEDKFLTCWIVGDSWIFWAQRYAIRNYFAENLPVRVKWLGFQRMKWEEVLPELSKFHKQTDKPNVIILHVGAADLGYLPAGHLAYVIKKDLAKLRGMFPSTHFVFSQIAQRQRWLFSTVDNPKIELARYHVNRVVSAHFRDCDFSSIDHDSNILHSLPHLYRKDGIHLSDEGTGLFLGNILEVLTRFLH